MFGFSGEKLIIIGLLAIFVLGPDRLPQYAAKFAQFVKTVNRMADGAKTQLESEIGEEVDWAKLDPRQYDPRRIIREALIEDEPAAPSAVELNRAKPAVSTRLATGESAPYDSEAT
jgi:sec-independent protein translocase protein TatB